MTDYLQVRENEYALLGDQSLMLVGKALDPKPRTLKDPDASKTSEISNWGDDNNYPQWVLEQIKDVTLVEPILDWKARALYSGGLAYGVLTVDENGEEQFRRIIDSEIEQWLESTDIHHYIERTTINFYTFWQAFAQLTQGKGGNKIVYLTPLDTPAARYQKKATKPSYIKKLYYSPDWEKYNDKSKEVEKFDLYNPIFSDLEAWKKIPNHQFAFTISSPTPGRAYYQKAPWHVILTTWIPIARAIPEFKKALLKNQLTIKYIIKVPEWWWSHKYKDWERKTEKQRLEIFKKEKEEFEKFFKGERQGNSLMYTQKDSNPAKKYSEWEVTVIDDKVKTGMYIEDSQEADAHIFKNLGVDPTLFGNGSGKDRSGAGSGSDKRVAWNNYIMMTKPHQDKILAPLQLIARWNGWDQRLAPKEGEKLVFWMKNYQIARLDSGSEVQESSNSNKVTS